MRAFRTPSRTLRRALLLAAVLAVPSSLHAQSFAVGGNIFAVNDVGSAAITSGFQTWGGSVFGELTLDRHVVFQVRGERFSVRGSGMGAPNIRINAATVTVAYLFSEDWFSAGLFAGFGGYFLRPASPGPGEEVVDRNEEAFGFCGGLITIFEMGPRWDVRVHGMGHLIRSNASRKPIEIGLGLAYHF